MKQKSWEGVMCHGQCQLVGKRQITGDLCQDGVHKAAAGVQVPRHRGIERESEEHQE